MRKFTSILSLMIAFVMTGFAQDSCSVNIQQVQGATILQAVAYGNAPFTYLWNDGSIGQTVLLNALGGSYCVTVTSADGCTASGCFSPNGGGPCDQFAVSVWPNNTGGLTAYANNLNTTPVSYTWTGPGIAPGGCVTQTCPYNGSGTYCVTATSSEGCVATTCYNMVNMTDSCYAYIESWGDSILMAYGTGTGPFTYSWNNNTLGQDTWASAPGLYCVTITNADGCSATACYEVLQTSNNCSATISVDVDSTTLTVIGMGEAPYMYFWDNNVTTQSITINAAGTYCVSIMDAGGCVTSTCISIYGSNGGGCNESVVAYSSPNGVWASTTNPAGSATYLWSNGFVGSWFMPDIGGIYCVTATFANGCTASDCVYYGDSITLFNVVIAANGSLLTAVPSVNTPVTYLWNTGATTQSINVTADGIYCVTIMGSGAVATACYNYQTGSGDFMSIFGQINMEYNQNVSGTVWLIEATDNGANDIVLTAVDSVQFSLTDSIPTFPMIGYNFSNVAPGTYYIKAALNGGSWGYANYLPTYYGDVLYWDEATTMTPGDFAPNIANITMISGSNPGGPGFVGGLVSEGANFTGGGVGGNSSGPGDPVANATVALLDLAGNAVAYTFTNAIGHYQFDNIAYGDYTICIDHTAFEHGCANVTVSANSTPDVNFTAEEGSIISSSQSPEVFGKLGIAPNPADQEAILTFTARNSGTAQINLLDVTGRRVRTLNVQVAEGQNAISVPMNDVQTGVYFVQAISATEQATVKVVKR